jgi:Protein of unknown function (DUF2568)
MTDRPTPVPEVTAMHLVAFVAEVALIVALAWSGWLLGASTITSLVLAVLLPLLAMTIWGIWCAPRATRRLPQAPRWIVKGLLFAAAFVLLVVLGPEPAAAMFGAVMVVLFAVSLPADRSLA